MTDQQFFQQYGGIDPSTYTPNGDGSYTFTSGPYLGQKLRRSAFGAVVSSADDSTGQILKNGQPTGAPFSLHTPLWQTALKGIAPWAGAGLVSAALAPGGAAADASAAGDNGPTSAYTTDPTTGDITGYAPGGPGSPGGLNVGNLGKLLGSGAGLAIGLTGQSPTAAAEAPLLSALNATLPALQQRVNETQPLFANVVNMAHGMLPKAYQ